MASGDRLQVVLEARDEMTQEIRQAQKSIRVLEAEQKQYAQAAESGNKEAARSYERVRQEIIQQKDAQERLKAEQKLVAAEARKVAQEQAKAAMKARMAAREQQQQVAKVSAAMGRLGDKIGLQGRSWDKVASKSVEFRRKWESALERVGLKAKETNRDIEGGGKRGGMFAAGWGKVAGVAAVATGAVLGLQSAFTMLSGAVNEARQARLAAAQMANVMRSMGRSEAPERINRMIDGLEQMSGIDGDNIREMTNILFTFGNVTGKTFEKANALALDVSVAFGKDLQSSAVMVGKALNDPIKGLSALTRIGVQFTDEQTEQVKAMIAVGDQAGAQKVIMKELEKQVGGSAKAQADGIARTSVAWGNLKEAIGEVILSTGTAGTDVVGMLNKGTAWIQENKGTIISVLQQIMSITFRVVSVFLKFEALFLKFVSVVVKAFAELLTLLAKVIPGLDGVAEGAQGLAKGLGDASTGATNASDWFWELSDSSGAASKRTKELADALKQVKSKKVRLTIETTITDVYDAIDQALNFDPASAKKRKSRWTGGPVSPGEAYNVGEIGPELFVPKFGRPAVVGADGPEVRDFPTSGFIVPNHLLEAGVQQSTTVVRERVVEQSPRGPLVENLVVRSEADAMRELERLRAREVRIERERR